MKKNWQLIRGLMGQKFESHTVKQLVVNNEVFSSTGEIAEVFNIFFTSIGEKLSDNLPASRIDPISFLPPAQIQSFFLNPVNEEECLNIVRGIKNTNSDIDTLPIKIFKTVLNSLVTPLCKLINLSFSVGIFPDAFKISRITQIFKSGNPEDPSNYRPISKIPYVSKILEKCLCNRLVTYFEKFSLFSDVQYAFRKNK